MSKYQIILVLAGIVLVGWLFSLPKSIVTNKKQKLSESSEPQPSSTVHSNISDSLHTISAEGVAKIKSLKLSLASASNIEERVKFADSLSSVYKKNNRVDSAAYFKEKIAELKPGEKTYENAADMYTEAANISVDPKKVKDYSEKARGYYEKVLNAQPGNLDAKSKLAMTYVTTETPMAGIKMLREVVEKDPDNVLANFNLGLLSIQSKQFDKAIQRFEKLVAKDPENWKARFYLGVAYQESGNKQKSKEQFELVKKLQNDPEVTGIVNRYLGESPSK
jgi:outer membrane protein